MITAKSISRTLLVFNFKTIRQKKLIKKKSYVPAHHHHSKVFWPTLHPRRTRHLRRINRLNKIVPQQQSVNTANIFKATNNPTPPLNRTAPQVGVYHVAVPAKLN